MALAIIHPLAKTAIDARRAIQRLETFMKTNAEDHHVTDGTVEQIIEDFKEIRRHIPKHLIDVDLTDK